MTGSFSPREFLRTRQAVLVHFSTNMSRRPELVFPNDLRLAMHLQGKWLSFSAIQPGDTNPDANGRGGAEGSIGLLVDISRDTIVHKVYWADIGSNDTGSFGLCPTEKNCADSIDKRRDSNEWRVENYLPVGIFILPPIIVRHISDLGGVPTPVPRTLTRDEAIAPFPEQRVFSANQNTFLEFDRTLRNWCAVAYDHVLQKS